MKKLRVLGIILLLVFLASIGSAEMRRLTYNISVGADVTDPVTKEIALPKPMMAYQMEVTIPATNNNRTFTVAITNVSDVAIRSYAGLADETTHVLIPAKIIANGYKLSITASGETGNAITITTIISYAD